jgi:CHAD domain-containing protein
MRKGREESAMEVEAKFVIPDQDTVLRLQGVVRLGPFSPGEVSSHQIVDRYLDTEEYELYRTGYACRIRERGERRCLTLKGLGRAEDGIHKRFEIEQLLPVDATTDVSTWDEGEGRDLVLSLLGAEGASRLTELFRVEQARQVRPLRRRGRKVAELSLDETRIVVGSGAGERTQEYSCLEAELAEEGTLDDLRLLSEHLATTWGLPVEPRSKFELGLALLEDVERRAPESSSSPEALSVAVSPSLTEGPQLQSLLAERTTPPSGQGHLPAAAADQEESALSPPMESRSPAGEPDVPLASSEPEGMALPKERPSPAEAAHLQRLAEDGPSDRVRRQARLILGWGAGLSVRELREQVGYSQSWSYELIERFQAERMAMFPVESPGVDQHPREAVPVTIDKAQAGRGVEDSAEDAEREEDSLVVAPTKADQGVSTVARLPTLSRVEGSAGKDRGSGSSELTGVDEMCERFQVDMAHARYVRERALELFDVTASIHRLGAERRRLLGTMATLHNVGLETDPDRHHISGREIILENPLPELTGLEQRMLAAAVYLHRKQVRRRRLEKGIVASLPPGIRQDTLVLAALVRMADGLDYSQGQSTLVERMYVSSAAIQVVVSGPSSEVDAARAQSKADLWEILYGDTPFFFATPSQTALRVRSMADSDVSTAESIVPARPSELLQSPGIVADEPMSEAGRKVLRFHFLRMLNHEPGTRAGEDIEELHDMRVATRRMRSAFRVFAPYYKARAIRPFVVGLRRTARALGAVRDLDVFMQKAQVYLEGLPEERAGELDILLVAWRNQRVQAREAMLEVLDGAKYRDFCEAFQLFLETPGAGARHSESIPPRPSLVRHVAPQLIYARWAGVQAFGPLLDGAPISVLHALRIECKRLRYTLEFFREVLGPEARDVVSEVVELQDHLGDLNDADVANALLSDFLFDPGSKGTDKRLIAPGVVAYLAVKQRELQRLIETFPQAWGRFTRAEVRQLLASAVSAL